MPPKLVAQTLSVRTWAIILACALILLFALGLIGFRNNLFRWTINPQSPYQTYIPPDAPDYADPESWALRPETQPPGAWERPWGVDVFFIHPTSDYDGDEWNAPIDDPEAADRLDQSVLPNHARPFGAAGPIYAPRFRQATLFANLTLRDDADQALELAYADVLSAFDAYMAADNRGRALLVAGVGQGGLMAQKLLADRFQDEPNRTLLVAAYIIDAAVPLDAFETSLSTLAPCRTPQDIQCVISWSAVTDGDSQDAERVRNRFRTWTPEGDLISVTGQRLLCVNPLLWTDTGDFAPNRIHRGGARAAGLEPEMEPAILPNAVSAQCIDSVLVVDNPRDGELRRPLGFGARFKTPNFNLFYADIAANAGARARLASAWLDENGQKPAPPLPPLRSIDIAPIRKVGEVPAQPPNLRSTQDPDHPD
ncbi:MAG: DUF3089 domain-containing protein [Pseudomonadota bacterium]